MSADPEKDSQRQDLQCDSSSSTGSESSQHETSPKELLRALCELNINDDNRFDEQPTTSSASSDFHVRNAENLQILQSPGSQDQTSSRVEINGGDFFGAHLGPKTTRQNIYLDKLEQSVHHHYHSSGSQDQGTSSKEPVGATGYTPDQQKVVTEELSTSSEDCIQLSDSIRMFYREEIDKGGKVFRGEQISEVTGSLPLAIKSLKFNKKNKREAQILTKLRPHKHVVSIIHSDVYIQGKFKYIYIAMELCHTQNLYDHVIENNKNNVAFDPQQSISQAKQLVEGLNHIHSNDIVHRDFKPHNVLFSPDKKNIKIADFGISKEMTSGRTVTDVTNSQAGTDGYRAPETYISNKISKQTDIFSLGLVIYFLWSNGRHPFGDDPDIWNYNIKKNCNRDLSQLYHILEDQGMILNLLESMLQADPKARPTVSQILSHRIFCGNAKIVQRQVRSPNSCMSVGETEPSKRGRSPEEKKLLEEKAQQHLKNEEYLLASEALQELLECQTDSLSRIKTIQLLAECHVMCNVPIHEHIENVLSIWECSELPIGDIENTEYHQEVPWFLLSIEQFADNHFKHSRFVHTYFMYLCASKWYKTHSAQHLAVRDMERCIKKVCDLVKKEKQILSNIIQSGINEMVKDLAACYLDLGCTYNDDGEYWNARNYLLKGLDVMKNHFKGDAVKYELYGHIWRNLRISRAKLGYGIIAWRRVRNSVTMFIKEEDCEGESKSHSLQRRSR